MTTLPPARNEPGAEGADRPPTQPSIEYSSKAETRNGDRGMRRSGSSGWIFGVVLILIGVAFFLHNFNILQINNWWALFLLIPTIASFVSAFENYRYNQRLTRATRGSLIGGLFLLFLTGVFLFGLDLGTLWPILLVIGGISLLLSGLLPD
jgi:hypothetical protein